MTTHQINNNPAFVSTVTVRESDEYTQAAYVKFERQDMLEDIRGCNEMFLSVSELENLGRFLIAQSQLILQQQVKRHLAQQGLEQL